VVIETALEGDAMQDNGLDDKSIGELWREHTTQASKSHPYQTMMDKVVVMLIHKLVEERANHYDPDGTHYSSVSINQALHDFNIDPKMWKEE